jgi:hypothetical protein
MSIVLATADAPSAAEPTAAPPQPGTPLGGGFYAGRLRVGDALYEIIVAPKDPGETQGKWLAPAGDVPGATSCNDGRANTAALAEAGSQLAKWAQDLRIDGRDDWYLPSRDELELAYRNLKPTDGENWEGFRNGENPSSVPAGYSYVERAPAQTEATAFRGDGEQAFSPAWHWSSTQYSPVFAWVQYFAGGIQNYNGKSYAGRARAVRRFKVE